MDPPHGEPSSDTGSTTDLASRNSQKIDVVATVTGSAQTVSTAAMAGTTVIGVNILGDLVADVADVTTTVNVHHNTHCTTVKQVRPIVHPETAESLERELKKTEKKAKIEFHRIKKKLKL